LEKFLSSSTSGETSELQKLLNYARNMKKMAHKTSLPGTLAIRKSRRRPSRNLKYINSLEKVISLLFILVSIRTLNEFLQHPIAYNEVNME